jgi:hypothetical protein
MPLARFRRPAAALAALGVAAGTTVAVQLAGTGTAAACTIPSPANTPISHDAPYDTPATNRWPLTLPAREPGAGADHGHLPRWKQYPDGRVLLREDRVTVRVPPEDTGYLTYSNVNPRLRSYWLDPAATITVGNDQYLRMTGRSSADPQNAVTRQQFLDSFNTHGNQFDDYLKYRAVYRLTFDAGHTRVVRITEVTTYYAC